MKEDTSLNCRRMEPISPRRMRTLQAVSEKNPGLILQTISRSISEDELKSEFNTMYTCVVNIEEKILRAHKANAARKDLLSPDHWDVYVNLHYLLLGEYYDLLMVSHHPRAPPRLHRLAVSYRIPARMWGIGIYNFLELLRENLHYAEKQEAASRAEKRQRIAEAKDYLFTFISLAYTRITMLYEEVPAFQDTWTECLGDLSRYRMAVEQENMTGEHTWTNMSRWWYLKFADKNPSVGRLYHHLAILAGNNALEQIYYYSRSMNSVEPFPSVRQSVMTLFEPFILDEKDINNNKNVKPFVYTPSLPTSTLFTGLHAIHFQRLTKRWQGRVRQDLMVALEHDIGRVTAKWKNEGVYIAVTNISGWFDYGSDLNPLRQLFLLRAEMRENPNSDLQPIDPNTPLKQDSKKPRFTKEALLPMLKANEVDRTFCSAVKLTYETFALVLRHRGDENVLPHVHVMLAFIATIAAIDLTSHLIDQVPWADVVDFLNTLVKTKNQQSQGRSIEAEVGLPLPEDWLIRGLI